MIALIFDHRFSLAEARDQVDEKLCDSFNTRGVMQILSSLMSAANKYISSHEASRVSVEVLLALSEYITETLKVHPEFDFIFIDG